MKRISIIIPCYNEENGVGKVIQSVPKRQLKEMGYDTIIYVIDNNSTDKTIEVAKENGAEVITEKVQGKGAAMRTGFGLIKGDSEIVIMLDGDNTYKPYEIPRLIEPIKAGFCDVVIGSRLEGKIVGDALTFSHRLANWFFTFFTRSVYRVNVTDTCTGFFAWKSEVVIELAPHIQSEGFAIEVEMITKMAKLGYEIYSVPITYEKREGESKLSPVMDGLKITSMLFRNTFWNPSRRKLKTLLTNVNS